MTSTGSIFTREGIPFPSVPLREYEEWGLRTVDLVNPPRRFWSEQNIQIPAVEGGVDARRLCVMPTPAQLLLALPKDDNWSAQSRRSIARLQAYFLICEDPQRRMDARNVETLAHQASLVRHVIDSEHLVRVLIADEVGLGKTVEAGLIIKELLEQHPSLRILYLAPARLVTNVRQEFERLGLHFRQWTAVEADARLTDPKIIASIHRAVNGSNSERVIATTPWDIIVVDECHHLSAWSPGGGNPGEAFKLVRELIARQAADGRVIFLSGTPHQGHATRFENLLDLLRRPSESTISLSGRVIYRTKDDIKDWQGNLLFPPRQVNDPLVVDLGVRWRAWIAHIHSFYQPPKKDSRIGEAQQRAAGWRCAQAMQWATSSPHAGLGYLVRQAIRANWDLSNQTLTEAIAALRPYRMGRVDEPIEELFQRIVKEVSRQQQERDIADIEDEDPESNKLRPSTEGLEVLLREGITILRHTGDEKWQIIKERLLDPAGNDKIVLFAQPVETVTALARFVEKTTGVRPAVIIGGQSETERQQEIELFRRPTGPRFLVSSRAGGEGINLQIARRLVHIDVPWNPMDLEQRVGRVHRFGSRQTIIVDTVVVKDSREEDAYRIARQKLQLIASTLVERDRFDQVFSRIMCLIPPEELQSILINASQAPCNDEEQESIARMVQQGFKAWTAFHERFNEQQQLIRQQDPGLVTWDDVLHFVSNFAGAQHAEGFSLQRFRASSDQIAPSEEKAIVVMFGDDQHYACGDYSEALLSRADGKIVKRLGLNLKPVAEKLRYVAFPQVPTGSAQLRWPLHFPLPSAMQGYPFGVLAFVRQTLRTDQQSGWIEQGNTLCCFIIDAAGRSTRIEGEEKGVLLRGIFRATIRTRVEQAETLLQAIEQNEKRLIEELRYPTEKEIELGIRYAVIPILAAVIAAP